jgi:hypothetical protein
MKPISSPHGDFPPSAAKIRRKGWGTLRSFVSARRPRRGSGSTIRAPKRRPLMSMTQRELDRAIFKFAKDYLLASDPRVNNLLDKYLVPERRPDSLPEIYSWILHSAKNANMREGVIEGGIGSVEALRPVLFGFEPRAIAMNFRKWEEVWAVILRELKPKGELRMGPRAIWPQFCQTIMTAAAFLNRFQSAEEFYAWADLFDCDPKARIALPLILADQIKGIGFALACDFVKEIGYEQYAKPDVQLIDIFVGVGLSASEDQLAVFEDVLRVAKHASATPYCVDKVFWLIGSGKFYQDDFKIGSRKDDFIKRCTAEFGRKAAMGASA